MVKQYPHNLYVTIAGQSSTDEDGNIIQSEPTECDPVDCRAEYNSGGKFITTDGSAYAYHFAVYMSTSAPVIPEGTTIRINSGDTQIFKGQVKSHSRGQLNYRLWV